MDAETPRQVMTRRFTLLDGMIVVGAVALGLAPLQWMGVGEDLGEVFKWMISEFAWSAAYFDELSKAVLSMVTPLAMTLTLGFLVLRLRKPRSRWRRLVRQPGVIAALVLVLSWPIAGAFAYVNEFWGMVNNVRVGPNGAPYVPGLSHWFEIFSQYAPALGGFAVVVAWSTQLVLGRWRAEPTWLDRLGRIIGVGWIVIGLVAFYFLCMSTIPG